MIPTVETERLRLRPFTASDEEVLYRTLYSDPEVMRFLPGGEPRPREKIAGVAERVNAGWDQYGIGFWALELLVDDTFAGHCGLNVIEATGEVEVLYALGRSYWGYGYATEGAAASLRFGFEERSCETIIALADPANRASHRVMEKIGMTLQREDEYFDMHVLVYSVRRDELPPSVAPYRLRP